MMTQHPAAAVPGTAALLVALAVTAPLHAQERDVARDTYYNFFGSSLDVDVETEAPGRIRFIRGSRSRIQVAGHSAEGIVSSALGGRGIRRLTLTALGSGTVDFVVVVPEDVRVRVRWPRTHRSELFGALSESATYSWDATERRPAFETIGPEAASPASGATRTRAVSGPTPSRLNVRLANRLARLTLRVEGGSFHARADRPFEAGRSGDVVSIEAPEDADLSITVPASAGFRLDLDGATAIIVDRGDVEVRCDAVLAQDLPDGRRWFTLTPTAEHGCDGESPASTSRPHRST